MKYQTYTNLKIEGKLYDKKALVSLAHTYQQMAVAWQQQLGTFILEWLDDKAHIIVHTSGSTGTPKPIQIQKQQMVHSALATGMFFGLAENHRALLCLPCRYIAGKMMVVRAFVLGLDLYPTSPESPLENIDFPIHFSAMVPLQVSKLLQVQNNLEPIKKIIIGGAPVHQSLWEQLQSIQTKCFATYGMTETVTHIAVRTLNGINASDDFKILPNVSIQQDGRACLVIHAPKVANETIVTNDVVHLKDAKTFQWLCRFDNIINTGGVKVMPEVIEKKLSQYIALPFFISAIPDERLGKKVILLLETVSWTSEQENDLQQLFENTLTAFEKPRAVFHMAQFERTATGKIQRKQTLATVL